MKKNKLNDRFRLTDVFITRDGLLHGVVLYVADDDVRSPEEVVQGVAGGRRLK